MLQSKNPQRQSNKESLKVYAWISLLRGNRRDLLGGVEVDGHWNLYYQVVGYMKGKSNERDDWWGCISNGWETPMNLQG